MHPPLSRIRCGAVAHLIALTTILQSVESTIVQRPSDTTAILNESTYFNCSTSMRPANERSISWFHFPLDAGGDRNYVYDNGAIMTNYGNRFAIDIDLSSGIFNLLALRLEPKDAGRYECRDDIQEGTGASAELTVLGSDLICESNMDRDGVVGPTQCDTAIAPEEIQLSCSVTHNGKKAPKMLWRKPGDSSTSAKTDCTTKGNRVTCNTTLTANLLLSGSVYYCELTTQQYICSLEISKILYVFRGNATVSRATYEEVNCSAKSSQSCSYKWKWWNGTNSMTVSTDKTLRTRRVGSHRCEATCPIANTSCVVDVLFVEVHSTEVASHRHLLWLLLLLMILPGTLMIIVVVLLRWRYRPKKAAPHKDTSTSQKDEIIKDDQSATPFVALNIAENKQVKQKLYVSNKVHKSALITIKEEHEKVKDVTYPVAGNSTEETNPSLQNFDKDELSEFSSRPSKAQEFCRSSLIDSRTDRLRYPSFGSLKHKRDISSSQETQYYSTQSVLCTEDLKGKSLSRCDRNSEIS